MTIPCYTTRPILYFFLKKEDVLYMPMSDTETELWQKYAATGDPHIREALIIQYLPLVRYVVNRLAVTLPPTIDQNDLYGYGCIGLIQSVEKFMVERGVKFDTYATSRIRGAILDELRNQDWVPRSVRTRIRQISEATNTLELELGRPVTDEEIANCLNIETRHLATIMSQDISPFLSLDELIKVSDDGQIITWLDTMPDKRPNPARQLEKKEFLEELERAIRALPERERILLWLYYQEGFTLKEIGSLIRNQRGVIGVSESRVCQLHDQAVSRIRTRMSQYYGFVISVRKGH